MMTNPLSGLKKGISVIRPKCKGSGIMLSDFIEETNGLLCLSDEDIERAELVDGSGKKYARKLLEYGANREGYWTSGWTKLKLIP
jgi:hypothetical protein